MTATRDRHADGLRAGSPFCARRAAVRSQRRRPVALFTLAVVATLGLLHVLVRAEDWPEYRGKGRTGMWNETGILDKFPEEGLKVLWRTPLKVGMTGPAVADGRIYVADFDAVHGPRGNERAIALDEK